MAALKDFHSRLVKLDNFAKEVPTFNIKGEPRVNTVCGGVSTILILILALAYAAIKLTELTSRRNPTINDSKIDNYFKSSETVKFNKINWRMAFSVENMDSRNAIRDPHYVKWVVRFYVQRNQ